MKDHVQALAAGPEQAWFDHLAAGRFMLQRGVESGRYVFYPRGAAPGTGEALEWVEASGRGVVYAVTVVRRRPPEPSYNVVLVDLEEGPRLMSRVDGLDPVSVAIGLPVRARIITEADAPLLVFTPAAEAQGE